MRVTFTDDYGNEKTYELRGGAWQDEMNQYLYEIVRPLSGGYHLCREKGSNKEFALYLPNYYGDFEENPYMEV